MSSHGRYMFGLDDKCVLAILDSVEKKVVWSSRPGYDGGPCYLYINKGVVYHKSGSNNAIIMKAKDPNCLYYHLVVTNHADIQIYGVAKSWISNFS